MSEEIKKNIATAVANRKLLWYYTPSQNSAEELEGIFVQREDIAKDAVERIKEGALNDAKHHLLFVGPRGCGKTHLVSIIYHRLMAMKSVSTKLRVAWLNEDEMSPSFLDLLVRIYRTLSSAYNDQFHESAMELVYDLSIDDAEVFLRDLILEKLGEKSLLVIVENLDELLKGLKNKGQMKWRAFIQDTRKCATLATAQKMTDAVKSKKAPFHGTFQIEHLEMLSKNEAIELLKKVAGFYKDEELQEYLNSSAGEQRVECLHLLTGGNHRVMIVLAQFVTKDSLEELIELFFKMLNELTPYYQERLRWLSPQQRKIITFLCSSRPLKVNAIAKKLFITEQTLSSQLRELYQMGYVRRDQIGRESLYQIAEPLMRMCVEVKENNQREPIKLIIEILKVWCNRDTLIKQIEACENRESSSIKYIEKAIEKFEEGGFFEALKNSDDFSSFKEKQGFKKSIDSFFTDDIKDDQVTIFMSWIYKVPQNELVAESKLIKDLITSATQFKDDEEYAYKISIFAGSVALLNGEYMRAIEVLNETIVSSQVELRDKATFLRSIGYYMLGDYESFITEAFDVYNSKALTQYENFCLIRFLKEFVLKVESWESLRVSDDSFVNSSYVITGGILSLICADYLKNALHESLAMKLVIEGLEQIPSNLYRSSVIMSIVALINIRLPKHKSSKLDDLVDVLLSLNKSNVVEQLLQYISTGKINEKEKLNLNIEEQSILEFYVRTVEDKTPRLLMKSRQ